MAENPFNITKGRIVLLKVGLEKYHVALINQVNIDGSVNLTTFPPEGSVANYWGVKQGQKIGDWAPPGVDAVVCGEG